MDLPTRLQIANILGNFHIWKGRLPSVTIMGRSYPAERASLSTFPKNNQIVLDGILCLKSCMDADGKCQYKSKILSKSITESSPETKTIESKPNNILEEKEKIPEEECPVCKYMKVGI